MLDTLLAWLIDLGFWKIIGILLTLAPVILLSIFLVLVMKAKGGFKFRFFNVNKEDTEGKSPTDTVFGRSQAACTLDLLSTEKALSSILSLCQEIEAAIKYNQNVVNSLTTQSQQNVAGHRMSEIQLNQIQNMVNLKMEQINDKLNKLETLFQVYKEFVRENESVLKDISRSNEQLIKVILDAFDQRK